MKPNTGTMGIGVFDTEGMEYCSIESLNYATGISQPLLTAVQLVNADQVSGGFVWK